jgi:hypothetical protein
MSRFQPNDFGVGVTFDVDANFKAFAPLDAHFRRVVSVETVFYQEPSSDILNGLENKDESGNICIAYAWKKGPTINLVDQGRIQLDAKARREIKAALKCRWKDKNVEQIEKDEGILLWKIFED